MGAAPAQQGMAPGKGQPGMGAPGMGAPGMGAPGMGAPGMGQPGMGQPGMGQTGMGQPGMGQTGMGQPGMGQPGMGAPALMNGMQSPMNSQMMNQSGMMNGSYGNASPNQTATSGFGAGKSVLSIADVDDADTTVSTTPTAMRRNKKGKKRDDDDDEPGLASLREDLRMWSTSGTEVGKHILEKMEKVERTVRIIEKTGERHSEILAR